jgi:hypothetical protein
MRESTSRNQANGSIPERLQEAIRLRNTAAVLPPPSLPKNVQLPRPSAMSRLARSVAPLYLQLAVFQKARQRLPLIERVAHRGAGWTLGQNLWLQLQQILVELADQPRRYACSTCGGRFSVTVMYSLFQDTRRGSGDARFGIAP